MKRHARLRKMMIMRTPSLVAAYAMVYGKVD